MFNLGAFLSYVFAVTFTPGPNNIMSMANASKSGYKKTLPFIYGITVISNFIIPYYKSNISLILFSIFLAIIAFISASCWALFGSLFNKFLSEYRKQFNIVMGLLLIYSALSISGITHLFY